MFASSNLCIWTTNLYVGLKWMGAGYVPLHEDIGYWKVLEEKRFM